jgi:hypothetical protein
MIRAPRIWSLSLAAAAAFAPLAARAGDATLAEALFRDGKALLNAGDYAHACPKLEESYNQDPATGTLLALALCYEQRGSLASAWTTYSQVAARAHGEGRADREQAARERVSALTPRLSKLTVQVPPAVAALPGLVVKRDGQPLAQAAWGSALPADAGAHTVEVSADGRKTWRGSVRLAAERDSQTLSVPPLEAAASGSTAPSEPVVETAAPPRAAPASATESASALRPVGLVLGGLGVVGVGVGAVFGLKAQSSNKQSKADGHCDANGCDPVGKGLRNDAFSAARVSTALFIAGGALVAGGVTLYLIGGPKRESAALALTPNASAAGAGLWLHGGF